MYYFAVVTKLLYLVPNKIKIASILLKSMTIKQKFSWQLYHYYLCGYPENSMIHESKKAYPWQSTERSGSPPQPRKACPQKGHPRRCGLPSSFLSGHCLPAHHPEPLPTRDSPQKPWRCPPQNKRYLSRWACWLCVLESYLVNSNILAMTLWKGRTKFSDKRPPPQCW